MHWNLTGLEFDSHPCRQIDFLLIFSTQQPCTSQSAIVPASQASIMHSPPPREMTFLQCIPIPEKLTISCMQISHLENATFTFTFTFFWHCTDLSDINYCWSTWSVLYDPTLSLPPAYHSMTYHQYWLLSLTKMHYQHTQTTTLRKVTWKLSLDRCATKPAKMHTHYIGQWAQRHSQLPHVI